MYAPWLINTNGGDTPPQQLTDESDLFILQVASPNPINSKWDKQRVDVRKFVLNLPSKREIAQALYLFSSIHDIDRAQLCTGFRCIATAAH